MRNAKFNVSSEYPSSNRNVKLIKKINRTHVREREIRVFAQNVRLHIP